MSNVQPPDDKARELSEEGRYNDAATLVIEAYGREVMGFLTNMTRDPQVGEELFQTVCIKIWKGLSGFRWKSSLRTWVYTIARNALISYKRGGTRDKEQRLLTQDMAQLPEQMLRTITREWHKTEAKTWLWDAISELPDDDRTLLVLRLGDGMKWSDIAAVMLDEEPDKATLKRKMVALRKRYERLKDKIRDKAKRRDGG